MIKKIEFSAVHFDADAKLKAYATRKIGKLDRYLPKTARMSAHADIKLREEKAKNKKQCHCEVILQLPGEVITVHEATINMYAAIDIVEAKLRNQIKIYKDKHTPAKLHRRVLARFRRKTIVD